MKNITDFFSSLSDNLSIIKTNSARSIIKSANDESNTIHSQCRCKTEAIGFILSQKN